MKKYEYVSLKFKGFFANFSLEDDYKKIIDEYARKGFKYVGFVPTKIEGYGRITSIDLIFEKDE